MKDLEIWLEIQQSCLSAKYRFGEKLSYIAIHWDGLQVFVTDGRGEMDRNIVERSIRQLSWTAKHVLRRPR